MKRLYLFISAALVYAISSQVAMAQTPRHFTHVSNTGSNATVGIPLSANPNIAGTALVNGDEIGVFTPDGLCVGAAVWTAGGSTAITVWGDNDQTPAVDGMRAGEQMMLCVWRQATNTAYSEVTITYSLGDGRYAANGINAVTALTATSNVAAPLAPILGAPNNSSTNVSKNPLLQWYTSCSAQTYTLQLSTSSAFTTFFVNEAGIDSTFFQISHSALLMDNTTYYWRVRGTNSAGTGDWSTVRSFTTGTTVGVNSSRREPPLGYALNQNYPNPFNPSTTIAFQVPVASNITLKIYDVLGKEITTLVNEWKSPGKYQAHFDASGLNGGVYFYQLRAAEFSQMRKLLLVK